MKMVSLCAVGIARFAAGCLVLALTGCSTSDPLTAHRVSVQIPTGWKETTPTSQIWPGERLATYKSPTAAIGFYRTLRDPGARAENLGRNLVTRIENLPGYKILTEQVTTVAGREASVVEIIAPGDGFSWAPSGLGKPAIAEGSTAVPTRRLSIGFAREADTLWFVGYYADEVNARPEMNAILKTLVVGDHSLATSSY